MEIAKMMMGGKSEGKYAYYAFQPVPSIPPSSQANDHSQSVSVHFSTYAGNLTLYYSDAIEPSTSGTGFVPVNPSTLTILVQDGQAAPTQLVGKYVYESLIPDMGYDFLRTYLIVSVDSIDTFYTKEGDIRYYLKCYYKEIGVSIGATKYGVTDQSDAYATRTLKADGFVYAKITGQTTV